MKKVITACLLTVSILANAQLPPLEVYQSTMKIGAFGEETYLCGLCEGDQCVFSFEEVNGKELKELEILEMPSSSKFMDYKTKKIENKTISITKTGIYKFRFSNSAISGRICKIKIQRIPASESTKNFNTSVYWKTIYDTTYTTVQERYLVKKDTIIDNILDQTARVHSSTAMNGGPNRTLVEFILPENTTMWSYWIGVGNTGKEAYKQAEKKFFADAAGVAMKIPGAGPMAALALGATSYFINPSIGDNIKYYFLSDLTNAQNFQAGNQFMQYKQGNVVTDSGKMTNPLKGKCYIGLFNDNFREGIDVVVKITAIKIIEEWGTRPIQKMHVTSRQEAYLKN